MKAMILAGGEGTRLRPLTCDLPKPMVPVANRPCMEHIINLLKRHGLIQIGVTLAYLPKMISDYFGTGEAFDVNIKYFTEEKPLGTAGCIGNARDFLMQESVGSDDSFLVISGDALTDINLTEAIQFHKEKNAMATLLLKQVTTPLEYGVVVTGQDGRIQRFVEKPSWNQVVSDQVNTGIYILSGKILSYIKEGEKLDFAKDIFPRLLEEGQPMYGYVVDGYWCDIGDLDAYAQANRDALDGTVQVELPGEPLPLGAFEEATVETMVAVGNAIAKVQIGENCQIGKNVRFTPPCLIGDHCIIGDDAYIGQYSVLGNYTVIEKNASLKASILWEGARVGMGAELRGALICQNTRVEGKTRIFEHAIVGASCIVGADTLIRPNIKVWPGKQIAEGARLNENVVWDASAMPRSGDPSATSYGANASAMPRSGASSTTSYGANASAMPRSGASSTTSYGANASAMPRSGAPDSEALVSGSRHNSASAAASGSGSAAKGSQSAAKAEADSSRNLNTERASGIRVEKRSSNNNFGRGKAPTTSAYGNSLFGDRGIEGAYGTTLTPSVLCRIASAFAASLRAGAVLSIAHDGSPAAGAAALAFLGGATAVGARCRDAGRQALPILRYLVKEYGHQGAAFFSMDADRLHIIFLDANGCDIPRKQEKQIQRLYTTCDLPPAPASVIAPVLPLENGRDLYIAWLQRLLADAAAATGHSCAHEKPDSKAPFVATSATAAATDPSMVHSKATGKVSSTDNTGNPSSANKVMPATPSPYLITIGLAGAPFVLETAERVFQNFWQDSAQDSTGPMRIKTIRFTKGHKATAKTETGDSNSAASTLQTEVRGHTVSGRESASEVEAGGVGHTVSGRESASEVEAGGGDSTHCASRPDAWGHTVSGRGSASEVEAGGVGHTVSGRTSASKVEAGGGDLGAKVTADFFIVFAEDGEQFDLYDETGALVSPERVSTLTSFLLLERYGACALALPVNQSTVHEWLTKQYGATLTRTGISAQDMMERISAGAVKEQADAQLAMRYDAIYFVLQLALWLQRPMQQPRQEQRKEPLHKVTLSKLLRTIPHASMAQQDLHCDFHLKGKVMRKLAEENAGSIRQTADGIQIFTEKGWILILPDGSRPVVRITTEGYNEEFAKELLVDMERKINGYLQ